MRRLYFSREDPIGLQVINILFITGAKVLILIFKQRF